MIPPRLRLGYFADQTDRTGLATKLAELGHHVVLCDVDKLDLTAATEFEAVVLAVADDRLAELVAHMAPLVQPRQIVIHTALGRGAQVLDLLETAGAVVGALAPLDEKHWAIDYVDELGHAVLHMLIAELGLDAITVPESRRAQLVAGLTYARLTRMITDDARVVLAKTLGDDDAATDLAFGATPLHRASLPNVGELVRQHSTFTDPGMARTFCDLVRRVAEQTGAHDIELWAMGQDKGI